MLSARRTRAAADEEQGEEVASQLSSRAVERRRSKAGPRQQTVSCSKRARLESQEGLLQKEAAAMFAEADRLSAEALKSKSEEQTARSELAQLERPTDDDQTLSLEDSELGEID
jgi:hypothetical protein